MALRSLKTRMATPGRGLDRIRLELLEVPVAHPGEPRRHPFVRHIIRLDTPRIEQQSDMLRDDTLAVARDFNVDGDDSLFAPPPNLCQDFPLELPIQFHRRPPWAVESPSRPASSSTW